MRKKSIRPWTLKVPGILPASTACSEVNHRQFQDLTRNSLALQHQCDLFSSGLIENHCDPCDFAQRRKLYEEHEHKQSNAGRAVKMIHEFRE